MPIYNYKCNTCGNTFEFRQSINDKPLTHCIESLCQADEKGKGEVQRVISKNIGLVFNGSGFYITDYANSNKNNTAKSENISNLSCNNNSCGCSN